MTFPLDEKGQWFDLMIGDSRLGACATEGCGGQPTKRLEADGVGSNYCSGCAARIEAISAVALPDELEVVAWECTDLIMGGEPGVITDVDHAAIRKLQPNAWSVEELVRRSQARSTIATLRVERDEAQGKLALIVDRIVYSDSYGVPGSDFQCCHLCNGGGAPGVPFEHDERCPVRQVERDYEQWFDDIRATEGALRETEARAETAEAEVKRLIDKLRKLQESKNG